MANHIKVSDLPKDGERFDVTKIAGVQGILGIIALVGLVLSVGIFLVGGKINMGGYPISELFSYSWLYAFYYFFTIVVGGLFWVLLHNATNSGWGVVIRRIWEHMATLFPVMAVLAIPFLFPSVQNALWEWMAAVDEAKASSSDVAAQKEHLYHAAPLMKAKAGYLNMPFWTIRFIGYFACFIVITWQIRKYSLGQDKTGLVRPTLSARRASCGWLVVFAVCATFASIDWLKGLDYKWFSTMWGVYIFAGSALNSMAITILVVTFLRKLGYLQMVTSEHYHLMGKLMHAFIIFWAYIAFSQFFLIWYANVPEETGWFLLRNTDGWNTASIALVFIHFVIPFVLLVPVFVKSNPKLISLGAIWMLMAHALDFYIIVAPERGPSLAVKHGVLDQITGTTVSGAFIFDILAFVTIGALLTFIFFRTLGRASLYPCKDPRLAESVNVIN